MPKKALDSRITALIRNSVQTNQRSFVVLVGDRGRDQVVNLHWLLSQTRIAARPNVLWCYKKDLGFTSHRKKREQKIRKEIKRGMREINTEDPFELFIAVTDIRYTYYKETENILGNTYGMCVLQDFEALTPNLLARTIETVEGGGIDVHSRYRTEAHTDVIPRFNERFILSLSQCPNCLVIDDELNVLPISGARKIEPMQMIEDEKTSDKSGLKTLKEYHADNKVLGALLDATKTEDQAHALIQFIEAISEKSLRTTASLTAPRGRGKSACLGLAISGAIAHGFSNIFITSPSPENLKTLFEFIFKGFDALGYEEHVDYDIVQSIDQTYHNAIVRVNVFKFHRQTIQYIQPTDSQILRQAELVVIDEAAAIPLPIVKNLIGNYLVFMASTINGYEGTGRSLSLKLIQQLREQSRTFVGDTKAAANGGQAQSQLKGGRVLREIALTVPIRYASEDPVEKWLNSLLCLDATIITSSVSIQGCPHPASCNLFAVNRDTLFSFHPVSEAFLQKIMALYVASHYKNSPNDLQLLSDAPAHQVFVLLPPVDPNTTKIPEPLCVLQVALEGRISRESVMSSLNKGLRTSGDLIPWLVSQQFQDSDFASLSGARIVRIATNPAYMRMGYGARALDLLKQFYGGAFASLDVIIRDDDSFRITDAELEHASLYDQIKVKDHKKLPPLLQTLSEVKADCLDYIGVSYGLTSALHRFWKRAGYVPVYLRQTANDLTGEHTCVMLQTVGDSDDYWLKSFALDFQKRFLILLSYQFRSFSPVLALSIMEAASISENISSENLTTASYLRERYSPYDLKRLESYANNMLDYHVILDLLPDIAYSYFMGKFKEVNISGIQSAILLSIGMQRKSMDDCEKELKLPSTQVLAMFAKILRKVSVYYNNVIKSDIAQTV